MIALSKKPASSPNRPDNNFPPPLMGFLRINRSRGRSRSSPIFYTRRRRINSARVVEATQDPSSPKVTCIGQVRARRSAANRRPCWLIEKTRALFSGFRPGKGGFGRVLGRWALLFRREKTEDAPERNDENAPAGYFSPPENAAVILTRCRSTPYKPSSLGGLFWGSNNGFGDLEGCSSTVGAVHPLLLTRCNSEPARRGERVFQKHDLSRQRRLGAAV